MNPHMKPENGIRGLRYWKQDVAAGLVVSMINLPLSCGIAIASGAPPIAGLIAAIVAGILMTVLGGSFTTISGPAAGLAPALLAGIMLLGNNNRAVGYPLLLVAICLTGPILVLLARLKLARYAAIFPASVVEGMLAAIGLLIIVKQLPLLLGHRFEHTSFWGMLYETPHEIFLLDRKAFFVGIVSLVTVFGLDQSKGTWKKKFPPQVVAVVVGVILAMVIGLDVRQLIQLPTNPLEGITFPNFAGAFRLHLGDLVKTVVILVIINGVEGLATISAVDKIDPFARKSDPNRTLQAIGVTNLCSGLLGGLPIIPEAGRSTACVASGGRTLWANFWNALFLLLFLFAGRFIVSRLPMATLGAVIIFTGWRLCKPEKWRHANKIGREQLIVFSITALVTVSEGLFEGILVGLVTELCVNMYYALKYNDEQVTVRTLFLRFFQNPVKETWETQDGVWHIRLKSTVTCFNSDHLRRALSEASDAMHSVKIHLRDVTFIDHTSMEELRAFKDEVLASGRTLLGLERGLQRMQSITDHPSAVRMRVTTPPTASAP